MRKTTKFVGVVTNAIDMLHKRLGRLSHIVLQVLNSELKLDGCKAVGVCDMCHKTK